MANLIVYYSRKGENYWNGSIKNLKKGNTERVAEFIQKAVGGDLFEVETVKPYSADYYECIEEAKAELRANARPEIKGYVGDISKYDTIFVGYPNWWGRCPCVCVRSLNITILRARKSFPFAQTRVAAWVRARGN